MKNWILTLLLGFCTWMVQAQNTTQRIYQVQQDDLSQVTQDGFVEVLVDLKNPNASIEIDEAEWEPLTQMAIPANTRDIAYTIGWQRKIPKALVRIPAIVQTNDGLQRLTKVSLKIQEADEPIIHRKPHYPENSVLATGKWYKIGVTRQGIHKIDAAFLASMGIDIASINPQHIRIYGNGGQVMNERPDDSEPNDLVQNAIWVSTSGTSFGPDDYILFYAPGLVKWTFDDFYGYYHTPNYFSDTAYYFITLDKGSGLRISNTTATGSPEVTFELFDDYTVIDEDSFHHSPAGKIWWSHQMFSEASSTWNKIINLELTDPVGPITIDYQVGSTVPTGGSRMKILKSGAVLDEVVFSAFVDYDYIKIGEGSIETTTDSKNIQLQLSFTPSGSGRGLLDYIRIKGESRINFAGKNQLNFRTRLSQLYPGATIAYKILNAGANVKVWDVSNPLKPIALNPEVAGGNIIVKTEGAGINELIAFNAADYRTPVYIGEVANQNLHALGYADLIIITIDDFLPAAQEIANLHAEVDGITTHIVTTHQIYNEFSSGSQDIAGIRNFLRMFYDRATNPDEVPKNVLLLGAASYDYKHRLANNTNFVPNYQTYSSHNFGGDVNAAYSTDDYFVLLDSNEVVRGGAFSMYDMGIGRIPVRTNEEAHWVVEKIKNYISPNSFGPWKNNALFVADDADGGGNFPQVSDRMADSLMRTSPVLNYYKLYADNYERVSGGSGDTYPKVADELNSQIYSGVFLVNYAGHGNPQRLAEENILTKPQIASYRNFNKLPIIITGTCDFGRYDNPDLSSGGVELFLKPDGGSIVSLTTTQQVYSDQVTQLISKYVTRQFAKVDGQILSLGEALMQAKNGSGGSTTNNVKFVILGDPALKPAIPKLEVATDSIKVYIDENQTVLTDTLSALGNYILYGSIKDADGNLQSDFNGTVYVTIFDKPQVNPIFLHNYPSSSYKQYITQNSVVYKGQVSVTNGQFSLNMIIPKDLNYDFGKGKISYYAHNEYIDGAGSDTGIVVGGFAQYIKDDNEPPVVKPYIDDDKFRDGGVTGPDPLLYVKLSDDNGINISGSSIGHDLIAVLDGDYSNPYILNNYYFTLPDDPKQGEVYFQLSGLEEGWHEIEVRAWDVYNNSGTGKVRFEVRSKDEAYISDVYAYPNPVTESQTHFVIQHNLKNENVDVIIDVFNTAGQKVKTIQRTLTAGTNRMEIPWNGENESGMQCAAGVYPFRVVLRGDKDKVDVKYEKLVIIR